MTTRSPRRSPRGQRAARRQAGLQDLPSELIERVAGSLDDANVARLAGASRGLRAGLVGETGGRRDAFQRRVAVVYAHLARMVTVAGWLTQGSDAAATGAGFAVSSVGDVRVAKGRCSTGPGCFRHRVTIIAYRGHDFFEATYEGLVTIYKRQGSFRIWSSVTGDAKRVLTAAVRRLNPDFVVEYVPPARV